MFDETATDEEIKLELLRRIPRAVTLARAAQAAVAKYKQSAIPDQHPFTVNFSTEDFDLWQHLCWMLSECRTTTLDEWLICGPTMLIHIRTHKYFTPAPASPCGDKNELIHIGHFNNIAVYLKPDEAGTNWFYIGAAGGTKAIMVNILSPYGISDPNANANVNVNEREQNRWRALAGVNEPDWEPAMIPVPHRDMVDDDGIDDLDNRRLRNIDPRAVALWDDE